jgi:hypothetical protein
MYMCGFAMLITNAYTVRSNVDIKFSANDACLERLESQMIYSLGSNKATFEIEQCWIFAVLWLPFWKWRPVEIFQCQESIQDVEIEQCWICAVLWQPFWKCLSVAFSKWPPQYRTNSTLSDFNDISYMGTECRLWCPEMIYVRYCGSHFENGDR